MIESFTSVFVGHCADVLSSKYLQTVFHSQVQLSDHLYFVSAKQLRVVSLFGGLEMSSSIKLFCNIRCERNSDKEPDLSGSAGH